MSNQPIHNPFAKKPANYNFDDDFEDNIPDDVGVINMEDDFEDLDNN